MLKILAGEKKGYTISSPPNIRPILAQIKKSVFDIIKNRVEDSVFLDLYAGSGSVGLEALSRGSKFCVFVEKERYCAKYLSKNIQALGYGADTETQCSQCFSPTKTQSRTSALANKSSVMFGKSYVIIANILKDLFWIDKTRKILQQLHSSFSILRPLFDIIFVGAPYMEKFRSQRSDIRGQKDYSQIDFHLSSRTFRPLFLSSPTIKLIYDSELLDKSGLLIIQHSIKEPVDLHKFVLFRQEKYGDTIVSFLKY